MSIKSNGTEDMVCKYHSYQILTIMLQILYLSRFIIICIIYLVEENNENMLLSAEEKAEKAAVMVGQVSIQFHVSNDN